MRPTTDVVALQNEVRAKELSYGQVIVRLHAALRHKLTSLAQRERRG